MLNRKKPNFMIVGAAKAGSTSLAKYLSLSEDVFISQVKEPRYFIKDIIKKVSDEDPVKNKTLIKESVLESESYYSLFSNVAGEKKIGEASIHYLYNYEHVIPKIKKELGDIAIIIILRNPVNRALSNINYLYAHHKNTPDVELKREDELKAKNYNSFWYYKEQGFYYKQVKAYLDNFTNVKIITTEDFNIDSIMVVNEVLAFLGAKPINNIKLPRLNITVERNKFFTLLTKIGVIRILKKATNSSFRKKMKSIFKNILFRANVSDFSEETKLKLTQEYQEDVINLEKLLDRKLWKY
jgi:hypothetical protein